jgi:hypothetical protein
VSTENAKPGFNWTYLSTFEPAVLRGLWVAVVGVLAAFGLDVSDAVSGKAAAVIAAATIIVPLIQAFWTRQAVSPVAKVEQLAEAITALAPATNTGTITTSGGGTTTVSGLPTGPATGSVVSVPNTPPVPEQADPLPTGPTEDLR